jgi:uncharacterized membrane protein
MPTMFDVEPRIRRWVEAEVIDRTTAERIRTFEAQRGTRRGSRVPVLVAMGIGALMVGAGVLLFVAAHWEWLSPAQRFALVLSMVAVFHLAGALATARSQFLSTALHAIGTASVGAGIFLAGQIFHLQEHWPGAFMLWSLGAVLGWALLRDPVQASLAAILLPIWLSGEWIEATERMTGNGEILAIAVLALSVSYFSARTTYLQSPLRSALTWIGGIALIPFTLVLFEAPREWLGNPMPNSIAILGWTAAIGLPMLVAFLLRRDKAWINAVATLWVVAMVLLDPRQKQQELIMYLMAASASGGMVAWGISEARRERINMGVAGFALTVIGFYFSNVMDKLGRSMSLITFGILFLVGGWALERTRRRLIAQVGGTRR